MNREELKRRYNLATNEAVQEFVSELLKFVVDASTSSLSAEKIQGMLILLNERNNWINLYFRELEKAKKQPD